MAQAKTKSSTLLRPSVDWSATAVLLPSLYSQGVRDGIYLAIGERELTRATVLEKIQREGPQYLEGFLVGVEHAGRQSLREQPGDSDAEQRCRYFVYRVVRRFPHGLRHINKTDLKERCRRLYGVGGRAFERIRLQCIARLGVDEEWLRPGPRGPHNKLRRQRRR
jgi:hypothetical protein